MRISDWSSDVCSSDLQDRLDELAQTNRALQRALVRQKRKSSDLQDKLNLLESEKRDLELKLSEGKSLTTALRECAAGSGDATVLFLRPPSAGEIGRASCRESGWQ